MTTEVKVSGATQDGRILIVDTDGMSGELLQLRFESEGFQCDFIKDGRSALKKDLSGYNIVIVDLMDQDFNGLMFTRAVKTNPDTFY